MPSREAIQRQIDRIKQEDDLGLAIEMLADVTADVDTLAAHERSSLKGQITMLREIIVGNGHPTQSLVARLETLEIDFVDTCSKVNEIHTALLGDLPKGSKSSILNRIEEVEHVADIIKRLAWLIATLFVGDILFRLFQPLILP